MKDLGLLALRLTTGGLLAGHGAQKLFGSFQGPGPEGTAGWLESMGLRPGKQWAMAAGLSEFGGGILTALGLAWPLGPIAIMSSMATAAGTAHRGKPIWATAGGAELPLTNFAAGLALMLTGPGRIALDKALGTRLPFTLSALALLGAAGGVALAVSAKPDQPAEQEQPGESPATPATQSQAPPMPDEGLPAATPAPVAAAQPA